MVLPHELGLFLFGKWSSTDTPSSLWRLPCSKAEFFFRFDGHSNDRSWSSGSGSPDAVSFSVDTDKVHVIGFGVFGGGKEERKYELELLKHVSRLMAVVIFASTLGAEVVLCVKTSFLLSTFSLDFCSCVSLCVKNLTFYFDLLVFSELFLSQSLLYL